MTEQEKRRGKKSQLAAAVRDLAAEVAASTGIVIQIDSEVTLSRYRRGTPLTYGDLRQMVKGAVVWVRYQEYGEKSPRTNGAYRLDRFTEDHTWILDDGSCFGADFYMDPEAAADAPCKDDLSGQGEIQLFQVVQKKGSA